MLVVVVVVVVVIVVIGRCRFQQFFFLKHTMIVSYHSTSRLPVISEHPELSSVTKNQ